MGIITKKVMVYERETFQVFDLLNRKDPHTGQRAKIFLGRIWEEPDKTWRWASRWGYNRGSEPNEEAAKIMIEKVAREHFGT